MGPNRFRLLDRPHLGMAPFPQREQDSTLNGVDLKIESFQIFGTPTGANRTRPVAHILHRFFPEFRGQGDQLECPLPLTPKFWRIYSERVTDFIKHSVAFLTAAEPVSSRRPRADLAPLE